MVFRVTQPDGQKLALKLASVRETPECDKLLAEVQHLKAGRRLIEAADAKLSVPVVVAEIRNGRYVGFIGEWLDGHSFADLFLNQWSPSDAAAHLNSLMTELVKTWLMGSSPATSESVRAAYVTRPAQRFDAARMRVRAAPFHALDAPSLVINGMACRNPITVLHDIPERVLSSSLRPCVSGDLGFNNVIAMPGGTTGLIDQRGHVQSMTIGLNRVPALDPFYDIGRMLFSASGWIEITNEAFRTRWLGDNKFNLELPKSHGKVNEAVVDTVMRTTGELFPEEITARLHAMAIIATGAHFLSYGDIRLRQYGDRGIDVAIACHLLGTLLLDGVAKGLETGSLSAQAAVSRVGDLVRSCSLGADNDIASSLPGGPQ